MSQSAEKPHDTEESESTYRAGIEVHHDVEKNKDDVIAIGVQMFLNEIPTVKVVGARGKGLGPVHEEYTETLIEIDFELVGSEELEDRTLNRGDVQYIDTIGGSDEHKPN